MLFTERVGDSQHHGRGVGGWPCLSHDVTAGRLFLQTPMCHCTGETPEESVTCSQASQYTSRCIWLSTDLPGPLLENINPPISPEFILAERAGKLWFPTPSPAANVQRRHLSSRKNSQVILGSKGMIKTNWGGNCPWGLAVEEQQAGLKKGKSCVEVSHCGRFSRSSCYGWAGAGPWVTQL